MMRLNLALMPLLLVVGKNVIGLIGGQGNCG